LRRPGWKRIAALLDFAGEIRRRRRARQASSYRSVLDVLLALLCALDGADLARSVGSSNGTQTSATP
jgi:hypothetical protein